MLKNKKKINMRESLAEDEATALYGVDMAEGVAI